MKTKCPFCKENETTIDRDVGSDIDPSGEERQHIERCKCGAWRFYIERWHNFSEYKEYYGKWRPKEESLGNAWMF